MYIQKLILLTIAIFYSNLTNYNTKSPDLNLGESGVTKELAYCVPGPTTPWNDYIRGVTFESISNPITQQDEKSGSTNPTGVHNYTSYTTDVYTDNTYAISVSAYFAWYDPNSNGTGYLYAWIDLNGDEDFDDAGENVLSLTQTLTTGVNNQYSISDSISIPSSATVGSTRMRIIARQGGAPTPCDTNNFTGEVEDYSVNILAGTDTTPPTVSMMTENSIVFRKFSVTATFSETITGVDLNDFQTSNGVVSNLNGSGTSFTVEIQPSTIGQVYIYMPADSVHDNASNGNIISDTLFVTYEPTYGDSSSNVALNKTTEQSSTNAGGVSSRAVDGNTDGNFYSTPNPSVSETNYETESWWQVDLGDIYFIETINLWNRLDNVFTHDYFLHISNFPFDTTDLSMTLADTTVWSYYDADTMGYPTISTVNRTGRYVRIQKNGTGFTSLAEVEVIASSFFDENTYVQTKKKLDGTFILPDNGNINFSYTENYNVGPSDNIQCQVYNWKREGLAQPVELNNRIGKNWQSLSIANMGLSLGEYYTLEVSNQNKDDKHFLRFRYCDPEGDLTRCMDNGQSDDFTLSLKVFLQGPWESASQLMRDDLRTNNVIPLSEPYTGLGFQHFGNGGNETINSSILQITGNNAIVDWVFVELRTGTTANFTLATQSALVQRDGDIVDVDGESPISFSGLPKGSYYIGIRHRNHLGIRSLNSIIITDSIQYDFTTALSQAFGSYPMTEPSTGKFALWAGNANVNNSVIYQGAGSDIDQILFDVINAPGNGSNQLNYIYNGYHSSDINLSGATIYQGSGNDVDQILFNVLNHPLNTGSASNFIVLGQLP